MMYLDTSVEGLSMRSITLKTTPVLLLGLGFLLYPRLTQYAQDTRSRQAPDTVTFRVLLGVGDTEPTVWDGSVKVSGGNVTSIQGWRFAETDSSDKAGWKVSTRRLGPQNAAQVAAKQNGPMVENGVFITAAISSPQARFDIRTPRGSVA